MKEVTQQLQPLSEGACQALTTSLLAAESTLEWQHPLGAYHKDYSYESAATTRARELLAVEPSAGRRPAPLTTEAVARVGDGDIRELAASLITHHLRIAGKIGTVSRETPTQGRAT